jgi:hypothetical protein
LTSLTAIYGASFLGVNCFGVGYLGVAYFGAGILSASTGVGFKVEAALEFKF